MWGVRRMLEIGRRESWSANTGLPGRLKLEIMKWWCYQSTQFFLSISVSAWNLCPPAASPVSGRKEGKVTSTTQSDRPCWNGPAWQPPSASSSPPSAIRLRQWTGGSAPVNVRDDICLWQFLPRSLYWGYLFIHWFVQQRLLHIFYYVPATALQVR